MSDSGHRQAVGSKMHTVRPGREGDVGTIVHDDPHVAGFSAFNRAPHEPAQDAGLKVPFAHLDDVHAHVDGLVEKPPERVDLLVGRSTWEQTMPIGHQAD
jgi:hypothetical protein